MTLKKKIDLSYLGNELTITKTLRRISTVLNRRGVMKIEDQASLKLNKLKKKTFKKTYLSYE